MKLCPHVLSPSGARGIGVMCAAVLLALNACGGGGGDGTSSPSPGPAPVSGTLAYVETQCRDTAAGVLVEHQSLRIRQGDRQPVTVFETPEVSVSGEGFLCPSAVGGHYGDGLVAREAFQQVTVSPDGASVAFETTDEFSVNPPLPLNLPPEKKGIFWVRADGTGAPRKLGPPSRERSFYLTQGFVNGPVHDLSFSPDGGTIVFVDKGPDANGDEADQVFTIDVATGTRTQVTHLPPSVPAAGYPPDAPTMRGTVFVDGQTIKFKSTANPNGLNPGGSYLLMTTTTDGSDLQVPLPITVPLSGSQVELQFVITGGRPLAINVEYPGHPTNNPPLGGVQEIWEVFVIDEEKNALQLTNFRRIDTAAGAVDPDGEHVYFEASADPLGTNPSLNCQIFSIDRLGSDLRQLTNFREVEHSLTGCDFETNGLTGSRPIGCGLYFGYQDSRSRSLLFYSECNPLDTNPNGAQIFAMRPDGSGLRQLTDSQGLVKEGPGVYSGAIPGPWAYGPYVPSF